MMRTDWQRRIDARRLVRQYRPEDRPRIAELFKGKEGPWADAQFWDWKFLHNPAGTSVGSVVEADGRAVGQIGSFPVRFVVQGREALVAHDHDMIVAPEQRSLRTFFDLVQARPHINSAMAIDFLYGCAPQENAELLINLAGAESVTTIPLMRRRLDFKSALRQRLGKPLASPLAAIVNSLFLRLSPPPPLPAGLQLRALERFDERFDTLWGKTRQDYRIMALRDARYLNWRFVEVPRLTHHILCIESADGDEVLGYAVLLPGEEPRRLAQITELITPQGSDPSVAATLIAHALQWAREQGASSLQCWMLPHTHLRQPLLDAGFFPDEDPDYQLVIRRTYLENPPAGDPPDPGHASGAERPSAELLLDPQSWFLSIGDADLF